MARKRHFFKRMTAALLSAALLALPLGAAAAAGGQAEGAQEPALVIYTTGDMAGRVYRQNPLTGQDAGAGYQNVAAAVAGDADTAEAALLLDSGDAVDSSLLQDGGAAEALALRAIGYDVLVPGLGELRLAPEDRADFFAALEAEEGEGSPVQVLSGTYLDGEGEEPVEGAYEVFSVELDGTEVRVGVLGLTAADVGGALPPEYQEDVRFAHQDNEENSLAWEWSCYWQERLEAEDCDLVVVVCSAERDAVAQFAAQTSGIDLVVGGRGSAGAETLQNADGEDVAWVSGGGAALTRTAVTLAPDGTPVVGESTLLELEDYEPDSGLSQLLSDSWDAAEERLQEPVGTLAGDWSEAGDPRYVQTATAELAAQAMVWAAGADGALLAPRDLGGQTMAGLFEEGEDTVMELATHINVMRYRLFLDIPAEHNPVLKEIEETFPDVCEVVREKLWSIMRGRLGEISREVCNHEAVYIAMYIVACMMKNPLEGTQKKDIIIVCNSTIATSKILESRLKSLFDNINVVKTISYNEFVNASELPDCDLVISTMPLESSKYQCITVNPLLKLEDVNRLMKIFMLRMQKVDINKYISATINIAARSLELKPEERIKLSIELARNINEEVNGLDNRKKPELKTLLEESLIAVNVKAKNCYEAIQAAGELLKSRGYIEQRHIDEMIRIKKKLGGYMVIDKGVALPHLLAPELSGPCMSMITLDKPVKFGHSDNDPVSLVIMLVSNNNTVHIKVLEELVDLLGDAEKRKEIDEAEHIYEVLEVINS